MVTWRALPCLPRGRWQLLAVAAALVAAAARCWKPRPCRCAGSAPLSAALTWAWLAARAGRWAAAGPWEAVVVATLALVSVRRQC